MKIGKIFFTLTVALIFSFNSGQVRAEDAKITDLFYKTGSGRLSAYFKVEGAFREEIKKTILTGAATSFSFIIDLKKVRSFLPDNDIAHIEVTNTIKYNNLKKEFIITRSWSQEPPLRTFSFDEAKQFMTEIHGIQVADLDKFVKGEKYGLSARAELDKVTLPFYLHYVFFFVSWFDFETDWQTIDFFY